MSAHSNILRGAMCAALALASGPLGCKHGVTSVASGSASAAPWGAPSGASAALPSGVGKNSVAEAMPSDKPLLGATAFAAIVYKEPRENAKRIGYLRVGAKVPRSEKPVGTKGCPGGWYEIFPKGFVCAGKEATINLDDPILKAASLRPNMHAAMPYRYAFVRAVLPLYLRVPTADEQYKSEMKLKEHLEWYEDNKHTVDKIPLGAFDVPLDERGVPVPSKHIGELGEGKTTEELGLGVLFGGQSEDDPIPEWLAGGKRFIPNVSDFSVPDTAVFADRARRFSGLGLIGSFKTGEDSLNRRFAITTDLRLAPTTKLKPDSGSPWHGLEIVDPSDLPMAFIREQGAVSYTLAGDEANRGDELAYRSVVKLSGKVRKIAGERYLGLRDGGYVRASDTGIVVAPHTWPKAAEDGEKWVEVSLSEQTLALWEGKRPVYATLVSTGRKGFETITGEFRVRNKHITATMDSDLKREMAASAESKPKGDKPPAKDGAKAAADGEALHIPHKGDGAYGVTRRRGEGLYSLKDVPYIEYFASGYALHAAYWHDVFGKQKSHGCVNLAPIDAHRVFMWTEPAVPEGWHGVNTGEEMGEGTTVIVHE